jgi:hypothetical protein
VKRLLGSVTSKLLLAFAGFLTAITILHTSLTAWLIERHGEADAINQLSRQLIQLQDDLQGAREALVRVALDTARDEKNLSDMAIVYSEAATLKQQPDEIRRRAVALQKSSSMNRLRLILASARLASIAVYLDGQLSHYVTREDTDLRGGTSSNNEAATEHDGQQGQTLPPLITPSIAEVHRVTPSIDFPADNLMVMRIAVPIQAVARLAFNETVIEHLAIATPTPSPEASGATPQVIGQFVFSVAFAPAYLQDAASKSGVMPAIISPDGRHRLQLVNLGVPQDYLARRDDHSLCVETATLDSTSYYHALRRWRMEGGATVILGSALSRAGTIASVRRGIALVIALALLILVIGMALSYA